eukprot:1283457-Amphidinium_carterae.1
MALWITVKGGPPKFYSDQEVQGVKYVSQLLDKAYSQAKERLSSSSVALDSLRMYSQEAQPSEDFNPNMCLIAAR